MKKSLIFPYLLMAIILMSCDFGISFTSSIGKSSSVPPSSSFASSFSEYFYPVDIPYDGLRIDSQYLETSTFYTTTQGTKWGNGATFEVQYQPASGVGSCIDGDTTVFGFPQAVADVIESNPKRVRYLNIDTPETSGTPEKWGLLAKQYTCSTLLEAKAIRIQTDPGDKLLDPYGRLLGWVWIQREENQPFELLNYWLVRQGLAEVKYLFGAGETQATVYENKTYTEWMYLAQDRAQTDAYGMHSSLKDPYSA